MGVKILCPGLAGSIPVGFEIYSHFFAKFVSENLKTNYPYRITHSSLKYVFQLQ